MARLQKALCAVLVLVPGSAGARGEIMMTLERALDLTRERAPAIISARTRIEEAHARLAGASLPLRDNPILETAAGRRSSIGSDSMDLDLEISQGLEMGGRRAARIGTARAALERETTTSEDVTRRLLRDVGVAFYGALHTEEKNRLSAAAETIVSEIARVTERRYETGDIAALDLNVAITALSRAHSEILAGQAAVAEALGDLKILLGLDPSETLILQGDLRDHPRHEMSELVAAATRRPDLRSLSAELNEAEAQIRLAQGLAWPDLGVSLRYEREQEAEIILGGVTVTLPFIRRGQELRAEAGARAERLRLEIENARRVVMSEILVSRQVYERRLEAASELERNALPALDDSESLARRSYETGEMSLAEYLVIRREILETRIAYLDRLRDAAVAAVEMEASAGVLR